MSPSEPQSKGSKSGSETGASGRLFEGQRWSRFDHNYREGSSWLVRLLSPYKGRINGGHKYVALDMVTWQLC